MDVFTSDFRKLTHRVQMDAEVAKPLIKRAFTSQLLPHVARLLKYAVEAETLDLCSTTMSPRIVLYIDYLRHDITAINVTCVYTV